MEVIARRDVERWGCDRARERARAVTDLRKHHLAAQHGTVEQRHRALVEVPPIECLELIGDQAAVGAQ